uniref:Uncharacterized protein n=1 Tax=Quercus lobata TaxID=97700 RepID=A0A7N2KP17_QUELO
MYNAVAGNTPVTTPAEVVLSSTQPSKKEYVISNMNSIKAKPTTQCHVVAMPYPGHGHINPMTNLYKILALNSNNILVTFVVTEEWLGFIGSGPKPDNIRFASIPNVIQSSLV